MQILLVYIVSLGASPMVVIQQPASSVEVCMKAGELISNDVKGHVRQVSFRCLPASYQNGGFFIKED